MTPIKKSSSPEDLREYDRGVLRSTFSSLFAVVIADHRKSQGFTFQKLAIATKRDKSEISRWFAKSPNWRIDTISDIASALDLEIQLRARERSTGRVFAPFGEVHEIQAEAVLPNKSLFGTRADPNTIARHPANLISGSLALTRVLVS